MNDLKKFSEYMTINGDKAILIDISGEEITIEIKGKKYKGPKSSIGSTLILIDKVSERTEDNNSTYLKEEIKQPESFTTPEKTCKNCKLFKADDCFGEKETCELYQSRYDINPYEISLWRKCGDASANRNNQRDNKQEGDVRDALGYWDK